MLCYTLFHYETGKMHNMKSHNMQKRSTRLSKNKTQKSSPRKTNSAVKSPRAQKRADKWALAQQIKMDHGCKDCGYRENPYALQFDHISDDKKDSVSNLIRSDYSWETILVEINKCEVVCANCHAIRTQNRKTSSFQTLNYPTDSLVFGSRQAV